MILAIAGFPIAMLYPGQTLWGLNIKAIYLLVITLILSFPALLVSVRKLQVVMAFTKFIILLVGYGMISILWSDDYIYGFRFIIKLYAILIILWFTIFFINNKKQVNKCEKSVFFICMVVFGLALIHFAMGNTKQTLAWGLVASLNAPTTSPANFSFLMGCGALLAFVNYLVYKNYYYMVLFFLFLLAVLWAYTRISMVGLGIALIIARVLISRPISVKGFVLSFLVATILALSVGAYVAKDRMFYDPDTVQWSDAFANTGTFLNNINTSGRYALWEKAFDHFSKDGGLILIGHGAGSTDKWLTKLSYINALHSDYLRIYFDLGIIGLVLFLLFLTSLGVRLLNIHNAQNNKNERKWTSLGISALIFYSITLFTDNSLNYFVDFGIYVFCFVGFVFALYRKRCLHRMPSETKAIPKAHVRGDRQMQPTYRSGKL